MGCTRKSIHQLVQIYLPASFTPLLWRVCSIQLRSCGATMDALVPFFVRGGIAGLSNRSERRKEADFSFDCSSASSHILSTPDCDAIEPDRSLDRQFDHSESGHGENEA